jgi:hypothetical protein
MTHPDWEDSVRVGPGCAISMSRRGQFLFPGAAKYLLQREFCQDVWAYVFWVLVLMVPAFLFFNPP